MFINSWQFPKRCLFTAGPAAFNHPDHWNAQPVSHTGSLLLILDPSWDVSYQVITVHCSSICLNFQLFPVFLVPQFFLIFSTFFFNFKSDFGDFISFRYLIWERSREKGNSTLRCQGNFLFLLILINGASTDVHQQKFDKCVCLISDKNSIHLSDLAETEAYIKFILY